MWGAATQAQRTSGDGMGAHLSGSRAAFATSVLLLRAPQTGVITALHAVTLGGAGQRKRMM
jgi:hypothetical protein